MGDADPLPAVVEFASRTISLIRALPFRVRRSDDDASFVSDAVDADGSTIGSVSEAREEGATPVEPLRRWMRVTTREAGELEGVEAPLPLALLGRLVGVVSGGGGWVETAAANSSVVEGVRAWPDRVGATVRDEVMGGVAVALALSVLVVCGGAALKVKAVFEPFLERGADSPNGVFAPSTVAGTAGVTPASVAVTRVAMIGELEEEVARDDGPGVVLADNPAPSDCCPAPAPFRFCFGVRGDPRRPSRTSSSRCARNAVRIVR